MNVLGSKIYIKVTLVGGSLPIEMIGDAVAEWMNRSSGSTEDKFYGSLMLCRSRTKNGQRDSFKSSAPAEGAALPTRADYEV